MFSDTHSNTAYWSSGDKWPAMICGSGERRLADAPPSFDAHREGTFATVHSAAPFYRVLIRVDLNNPSSTTHFVCEGLAGGGVIAIVELGGGWVQSDMDEFFRGINQPVPNITDVSVDGTQNTPDPSPNSADGEVALDIEVAAAGYYAATGKPATIRVYWAQDIAREVRAATADNCDVCSISWGADEANWGAQAGQDMEEAAIEATTAGMIVFAASGDNDSSDGGPGRANVDLPASAPHVIGCGGTSKTRTHETVCDTKLVVARNRWFESISLQRRVRC